MPIWPWPDSRLLNYEGHFFYDALTLVFHGQSSRDLLNSLPAPLCRPALRYFADSFDAIDWDNLLEAMKADLRDRSTVDDNSAVSVAALNGFRTIFLTLTVIPPARAVEPREFHALRSRLLPSVLEDGFMLHSFWPDPKEEIALANGRAHPLLLLQWLDKKHLAELITAREIQAYRKGMKIFE